MVLKLHSRAVELTPKSPKVMRWSKASGQDRGTVGGAGASAFRD